MLFASLNDRCDVPQRSLKTSVRTLRQKLCHRFNNSSYISVHARARNVFYVKKKDALYIGNFYPM